MANFVILRNIYIITVKPTKFRIMIKLVICTPRTS